MVAGASFSRGIESGLVSALEFLCFPLVVVVCLAGATAAVGEPFDAPYIVLAILGALLTHVIGNSMVFGEGGRPIGLFALASRILTGWLAIATIVLFIGFATKYSDEFSRRAMLLWFVSSPIVATVSLHVIRQYYLRLLRRQDRARRVAIVGVNEISRKLAETIENHPLLGMRLIGFFDDRSQERFGELDHEFLGELASVPAAIRAHHIDVVFIALPVRHVRRVMEMIDELHDTTASIYFVPDVIVFDLIQSKPQDLHGVPVISMRETPFTGLNGLAKRAMDLVGSAVLLLLLSPVLLAIAIGIRLTSPGSVLFWQRRYGLDGSEIRVPKFRSMTVSEDGDKIVQASRDDTRVTRFGAFLRKTSLDELPQLWCVLRGEMSLVGPRPHAVQHNEEYRKLIKGYMIRHKALPGITGWAQVNGFRGRTEALEDMEKRIEYDLEYLRNWSLLFDIRILLKTALVVVYDKNAY